MKKRYCCWLLIALSVFLLSACGNSERTSSSETVSDINNTDKNTAEELPEDITGESVENETENSDEERGDRQMKELIIVTGGQRFQTTLYDNETTQALMERLPMTLSMEELHGNEKFYYLNEGLPVNSERIDLIQTGDIMLFGSDCLVLFFDDFSTPYSYTKIGYIKDREAFANALEEGTVEITFETKE